MTAKKSDDNGEIVKTVRDLLAQAWEHDRDNRRDAASDLAFLAGDQWPERVRREREASGRPMLTINQLPQFLRQVTNDIRQANLAIKVSPVDDQSDPNLAKVYNGILKQIQYQSSAQHVYATAAEHQTGCGMGHWRVVTQYADDSAFDQEIRIKLISNPMAVYWDPAAVEPDRSDAMWCVVTELMPKATFKAKYPQASEAGVDVHDENAQSRIFWSTSDDVRLAEYWVKEPYKKTLALMPDGSTLDITGMSKAELAFMPPPVRTREQECHKVVQYLVSGAEILSGPHEWTGKHIPIVPLIGSEIPLERRTYRYGLIRFARDPQQLYNFYRTATAEMLGLQPKAPYLVTPKMIAKYKGVWDSANQQNRPYLPYDPDPDAPGGAPRREQPPVMPTALVQEAQIASDDMKRTTGIYDASLGAKSNEQSGRAILARQREGDVANYHYADNLQRSLEYCGRILIDLIPKVYDNERVIRLMGDDDTEEPVRINQVIMAGPMGEPIVLNDLSAGRFDIRVTIGPSYSTKRMEAADSMMQFLQAYPAAAPLIGDLIAKAMDFPEAEEIAKRLKNAVPPQILVDPEDPATQPPPPPNPLDDPMARAELQTKQAQAHKATAEARKIELETAALYQQNMLQPEPPLPPVEQFAPPQPEQPPMGGPQGDIPPEIMQRMMQAEPPPPQAMQEQPQPF